MTHLTGQSTAGGAARLAGPLLDTGTACTREEHAARRLDGLPPPAVATLHEQVTPAHQACPAYDTPGGRRVDRYP